MLLAEFASFTYVAGKAILQRTAITCSPCLLLPDALIAPADNKYTSRALLLPGNCLLKTRAIARRRARHNGVVENERFPWGRINAGEA